MDELYVKLHPYLSINYLSIFPLSISSISRLFFLGQVETRIENKERDERGETNKGGGILEVSLTRVEDRHKKPREKEESWEFEISKSRKRKPTL